ncbi:MAG: SusC/RagA family TonB-linked outer membrane protein [Bacteroides sp.]|nr:SusC/RagA family TonB-linked outer membrane protein [Bacteroides sp.]
MRNRLILLCFSLLLASQITLSGQTKREKTISLSFHNEPLSSAFKKIEKASGYKILFAYDDVRSFTTTCTIENSTAPNAVAQVIGKYPLNFTVKDEFISIVSRKQPTMNQTSNQQRTITGMVVDEKKQPLIGVSITMPGNNTVGTISDENGHFSINLPNNVNTLKLSYIGMKSQIVTINRKNLIIVMEEDMNQLDDVIVTGYQTISKERATGSFVKVSETELEKKRLSSISTLLEGEVSGYTDGLIRGVSSMKGETAPLYVIDGFPVEDQTMDYQGVVSNKVPQLNMEDIESFTVLKDAAAASIYGARAANGVIVITTKKRARSEKAEISFSAVATWSPYKYYTGNLLNSSELINLEQEWALTNKLFQGTGASEYAKSSLKYIAYQSAGIRSILNYYAGNTTESEMEANLSRLSGKGHNYYKQIEKYAKTDPLYQQYNMNITKTTDANSFKVSITYNKNQYEDKYTKDQSIGINLSNITKIKKWLSLEVGAYMNFKGEKQQTYSVTSPGYSIFPYDNLVNDDGSNYTAPSSLFINQNSLGIINDYGLYNLDITPMDELNRNIAKTNSMNLRSYARLNFTLLPVLKYAASFQYERGTSNYKQIKNKESYAVRSTVNNFATKLTDTSVTYNIPYGDMLVQRDQYRGSYNFRQQLDYSQTFAGVHNVTAILGTETRQNKITMHKHNEYGYDDQQLSYTKINESALSNVTGVLGSSSLGNTSGYYENLNRYVSFYGNGAYTWNDKYSFTASLRWDRSNLWGTSSKYQSKPIWSTGLGWIASHEEFIKAIKWINFLKVRLSRGITGNINPQYSPYTVATYSQNTNVGGTYGYVSTRPNKNLSWEKTTVTNLGIDFAILNSRVCGTIEYYNRYGERLLASTMGVPTEGYGYTTYALNNGKMRNRGIDISLTGDIITTRNFKWEAKATFNYNKNKITYVNVKAPVYYLQLDYPDAYPIIGNSYKELYAYDWAGLSSEGLPQVFDENGKKTSIQPTTLAAIKSYGSSTPVYSGSLGSTFSYKAFDLSFQFVYRGGYKMRSSNMPFLNYRYVSGIGYVSDFSNLNGDIANRWRQSGDEAKTNIPRATFTEAGYPLTTLYSVYYYSSVNILKADNLRLTNVALSYRLPMDICRKFTCKGLRIQANIENPYMWAKSKQAKYQLGGYISPNYVLGIYLDF